MPYTMQRMVQDLSAIAGIRVSDDCAELAEWIKRNHEAARIAALPIPIRLHCPDCGDLHIDVGEFATKPHHTHACQTCGNVWRPAIVHTVGVQFLPGFREEDEIVRLNERLLQAVVKP